MQSLPLYPAPRRLVAWLFLLAALASGAHWWNQENPFAEGGATATAPPLPPFPTWEAGWIGTDPLTLDEMRGDVWILKVWTFDCINCIRSMPFANQLVERYSGRARVLGIHSPEFEHERDLAALEAAIIEHDLRFPTYVDLTLEYFTALDPPGWPTFYVVDRDLRIRGRWVGEVRVGSKRSHELQALVDNLLADGS